MWILQSWIFPTESLEGTFHIFQRIQCEELQTQLKPWDPEPTEKHVPRALDARTYFCSRVWFQAQLSSQKKFWLITTHVSGVKKVNTFAGFPHCLVPIPRSMLRLPNWWSPGRSSSKKQQTLVLPATIERNLIGSSLWSWSISSVGLWREKNRTTCSQEFLLSLTLIECLRVFGWCRTMLQIEGANS